MICLLVSRSGAGEDEEDPPETTAEDTLPPEKTAPGHGKSDPDKDASPVTEAPTEPPEPTESDAAPADTDAPNSETSTPQPYITPPAESGAVASGSDVILTTVPPSSASDLSAP